MVPNISAELIKLANRPAVWILGVVFLLLVVLLGYLLQYLFIAGPGGNPPPELQPLVNALLPQEFLSNTLTQFTGSGSAVSLILGVMSVGSEYGWGTLKAALTQGSGRLELFAGKLVAIAAILLTFSVMTLGIGALSSYVIARILQESVSWPSLWQIVKAIGAGWLILSVFCALGVALATLFRGTALAIGLGLVYLLLLSNIVNSFAVQSDTAANVAKALPSRNSLDLGRAFGDFVGTGQAAAGGSPVAPVQAVLVLLAYIVVFVAIALALFKARDVD